jgi:hypothetical protein
MTRMMMKLLGKKEESKTMLAIQGVPHGEDGKDFEKDDQSNSQ